MADARQDKTARKRVASTYTWLMLGWGAMGLTFVLARGEIPMLIAVLLPLLGIVFSLIALFYSIFGIAMCKGLRRNFILPLVLSLSLPLVLSLLWLLWCL